MSASFGPKKDTEDGKNFEILKINVDHKEKKNILENNNLESKFMFMK